MLCGVGLATWGLHSVSMSVGLSLVIGLFNVLHLQMFVSWFDNCCLYGLRLRMGSSCILVAPMVE